MASNRGEGFAIVFGLIFGLIGFCSVVSQTRQLTRYVPVDAVILSARVTEHEEWDGDVRKSTYSPDVRFEYVVTGSAYTGRRVFPVEGSNSFRWSAQGWVNKFPSGRRVKAYYDPKKPAEAFLVRKVGLLPYVFTLIGTGSLLVGLGVGAHSRVSFGVGRRGGIGIGNVWWTLAGLAVIHYLFMLIRYGIG